MSGPRRPGPIPPGAASSGHAVRGRSFRHVRPGDTVLRMLAGLLPMELRVTSVDERLIWCGAVGSGWSFDRDTGFEVDEELGWGPDFGVTGSYLIDPTALDA